MRRGQGGLLAAGLRAGLSCAQGLGLRPVADTLRLVRHVDKPAGGLGAGPVGAVLGRVTGLVGLVSDKLGPEASRRVAGWAGPEPSLRHVRQAWPAGCHAFQDKKALAIVSTFSTKMDPWSWSLFGLFFGRDATKHSGVPLFESFHRTCGALFALVEMDTKRKPQRVNCFAQDGGGAGRCGHQAWPGPKRTGPQSKPG